MYVFLEIGYYISSMYFERRFVMREILVNRLYRHFKGNLYYVKDVAQHTETGEMMVVYQAMYGEYWTFVRPVDMFLEVVDPKREDNVTGQKYRFELYEG